MKQEGYDLMDAAFEVHNGPGYGMDENAQLFNYMRIARKRVGGIVEH